MSSRSQSIQALENGFVCRTVARRVPWRRGDSLSWGIGRAEGVKTLESRRTAHGQFQVRHLVAVWPE